MAKLKTKIQAFTILESMVAMVIVMIVFGLTSVIIMNISSSGITKEKQDAYTSVNLLRNETLQENRFIDETIETNSLRIEKTILEYSSNTSLKILLIKAYKGQEKLFESKEIVLINNIEK